MADQNPVPNSAWPRWKRRKKPAHRLEREQRAAYLQRESGLEQSLGPVSRRLGRLPQRRAAHARAGGGSHLCHAGPSWPRCCSATNWTPRWSAWSKSLFNDRYDILDGIAIASLGEVKSVLLAHRKPLSEATEIFCDTASLTSVQLLRVLLAERGLKPEFKPLANYDFAAPAGLRAAHRRPGAGFRCSARTSTRSGTWAPPGMS